MDKLLNDHNWIFNHLCGRCRNKMEAWLNTNRPNEKIHIARAPGYFYHYVGSAVVKSDYIDNIRTYLEKLANEELAG